MPEGTELYDGLRRVVSVYLSEASVQSSVDRVLDRMGLATEEIRPDDLPTIVSEAMIGLRLFCDPTRLGELMMDLAEYCERVAD